MEPEPPSEPDVVPESSLAKLAVDESEDEQAVGLTTAPAVTAATNNRRAQAIRARPFKGVSTGSRKGSGPARPDPSRKNRAHRPRGSVWAESLAHAARPRDGRGAYTCRNRRHGGRDPRKNRRRRLPSPARRVVLLLWRAEESATALRNSPRPCARTSGDTPSAEVSDRASGERAPFVHDFEGIRIDVRDWPLLVMAMPEGSVKDDSVREALAQLEEIMRETPAGTRFFQVTDLSRMKRFAPSSQRRYASEWTRRTTELAARSRLGGVIVAPSAMLRAILSAVYWLNGAKMPWLVTPTRAEGILHGIRALEVACPPLPAHLAVLRRGLHDSERGRLGDATAGEP